jgi:hypothetical protein
MWMYPGPSCPDRPSSEDLSTVEVDAQIHKVLDLRVSPNHGANPAPLWRGVADAWVSTLGLILVVFAILSFHCAHDLAQGLGVAVASRGMSTRPRIPQRGRKNVPLMSKCRCGERE